METIIDRTFGIGRQARSVMEMLDIEPSFADYNDGFYKIHTQTKPWYNGRERGFVVSMSRDFFSPVIHIAVYEHRNSDAICALVWETKSFYLNHPLEDKNIFDKAYNGGSKWNVAFSCNYGEVNKMSDFVYKTLKDHYNKLKSKELGKFSSVTEGGNHDNA